MRQLILRAASPLIAGAFWAGADLHAQTGSVSGRVVGTSAGITNAAVELVGRGTVLTTPEGRFRFDQVPEGEYVLRVSALSYVESRRFVDVRGDVVLEVVLDIAPLALDSLLVDARLMNFDGRVRDPSRDVQVMDALILTDLGHEEWSDQRGDFRLDSVLAGSAVRLSIRAFGYLPADTTLIADDDGRLEVHLARDTLVERLIAMQHERIVERAGERMYEYREALDREDLVGFSPALTLRDILEIRYPPGMRRRVFCTVLDEVHVFSEAQRQRLGNMFPQEVERMEYLEFRNQSGRIFMLRVYTRAFFQSLIAENRPLQTAAINDFTDVCT